jgi:hypothetical protein
MLVLVALAVVSIPLAGARTAPPATGVSIWMLVLVALAVVSIPLAGAWFIFVREANQQPRPNNTS